MIIEAGSVEQANKAFPVDLGERIDGEVGTAQLVERIGRGNRDDARPRRQSGFDADMGIFEHRARRRRPRARVLSRPRPGTAGGRSRPG